MAESHDIKSGMFKVLIANVINLIIGLLSSFILPKYLTVNSYATFKTYQLYISYIGLLHFGYVDSLYLLYGGEDLSKISKTSLKENLATYQVFQIVVMAVSLLLGFLLKNSLILVFSFSIVPSNMLSFYQCLYQASGEFSLYAKIINSTTVSYFLLNMFFIFALHKDNPYFYIGVIIVVNCCICVLLKINFWNRSKIKFSIKNINLDLIPYNIKNGILLTLGNLSSILLTGMDRLFVKFTMNNLAFAQYSFAVSIENFLEVLTSSVTITMYNFFCRISCKKKICEVRNMVMIFAAFVVSCAFPARLILEIYLKKYIESVNVMFLLFGAQIFYIIIKGVYVNLYKANKRQKEYFTKLICIIFLGFIFNIICYLIVPVKESFAIGTLMSSICWYFICIHDFNDFKYSKKEICYPFVQVFAYLTCGIYFKAVFGGIIYILSTLLITFVLLPETITKIVDMVKNRLLKLKII